MIDFDLSKAAPLNLTAVQRALDDLRQKIISLTLPPGTILYRSELSQSYGISQTPLRDALQILRQEGLVQIWPQSKTIVSPLNIPQIYETHFLRLAVETEVIKTLAETENADTILKATSLLKLQQAICDDQAQLQLFQQLDNAFHHALFEGVGRGALHSLITERSGHLARARNLHLPEPGKMARIVENHVEIIEALQQHDQAKAVGAVRDHLSHTITHVDNLRRQYPHYFSEE